jgi:serine/threonine protein kinase
VLLDREIHIMKNINHPNIVEFYDNFEDSKQIYLVLEYLSGGELY